MAKATKIVRLHERPDGLTHVLERGDEQLARAAAIGGVVADVTLDLPIRGKTLALALEVLRESRRTVDLKANPKAWGVAEAARQRVALVALPEVAAPANRLELAAERVEQAKAALAAAHDELAEAKAEVTGG